MFTSEALLWIELLLRERCLPSLQLDQFDNALVISHPGIRGQIVVDAPESGFMTFEFDPTCSTWDPHQEGWVAPLGMPLSTPGMRQQASPLYSTASFQCTPLSTLNHGQSAWLSHLRTIKTRHYPVDEVPIE